MRKTMNGHVRIMMDTDRPMLKSHMARLSKPQEMAVEDALALLIVNRGRVAPA
jgi:hypothetical protein